MKNVLIVDDNPKVCNALEILLEVNGISAVSVHSPALALHRLKIQDIAVVIQDMNFSDDSTSGEEGVHLFREIHRDYPGIPVLLLTGWASLETAVKLIKEGADDYLSKPWNDEKLVHHIQTILASQHSREFDRCGLIYQGPKMAQVMEMARRVSASDIPVLITGSNGTGKEMIARVIHENSSRSGKPMVMVNSGAIPVDLLESELFGAEPGAFTGAATLRKGRFEEADGGTLFLDEIGNLPLSGQMKLLRVLQSGMFERLGSSKSRFVNVRIISATNTDLPQAIAGGTFRQDLFYRLNVLEIKIPDLRERQEDIPLLCHYFIKKFASNRPIKISDQAMYTLCSYDWPGNVRELENKVQRALLMAQGDIIEARDLGISVDNSEKAALEQVLDSHEGNVAMTARKLGLSRQALYRKMEKLGIFVERKLK